MLVALLLLLRKMARSLGGASKPLPLTRRQRESLNDFAVLRSRLDRENQLHALMLAQRHFRRSSNVR
jgi:hypothetical protein